MIILQRLARAVAPPECYDCGGEGSFLCSDCRLKRLPAVPRPACFGCWQINRTGATCGQCRQLTPVRGATVAGTYDGLLRDLLIGLKYRRQREIAENLGDVMANLLEPLDFDVVTAVPVASSRYRHRSYNQAEQIARQVARRLGLPYRSLLWRVKNQRQVGSSRSQRIRQAPVAFQLRTRPSARRILLVDDVLTTGATLDACARLLTRAGAIVWAAAVARRED